MASSASSEATATVTLDTTNVVSLNLKPRKPKRSVKWTEDVIDNEHMNKKKSNSSLRAS